MGGKNGNGLNFSQKILLATKHHCEALITNFFASLRVFMNALYLATILTNAFLLYLMLPASH